MALVEGGTALRDLVERPGVQKAGLANWGDIVLRNF